MLSITPEQKRTLKARAHALDPVVMISQNGLSESVIKEIDRNLKAHELIKIRILSDERTVREQFLADICAQLEAAPVQHIGKLLVIWKPAPEKEQTGTVRRVRRNPKQRLTKRQQQGSTSR